MGGVFCDIARTYTLYLQKQISYYKLISHMSFGWKALPGAPGDSQASIVHLMLQNLMLRSVLLPGPFMIHTSFQLNPADETRFRKVMSSTDK